MTARLPIDSFPHAEASATSGQVRPESLPPPTPLIGRERELATIDRLLDDRRGRTLTLTGPDGVGKTQLAIAAARTASEAVVFVPLAFATSEALTISAIAQALGASEQHAESLLAGVIASLQTRPVWLILDGAEHAPAVAPVVRTLLAECPDLSLLVTATNSVGIDGERVFQVPPLTLPVARNWPLLSESERGAAVALFIARARAAQPDFHLTMANAFAVAEICRRLDGLPLAIEIAAARARYLPPQPMLSRLDAWLPRPADGPATAEQQEEILRSVITWSHDLLDPDAQRLLRGLSVFAGGATVGAATQVLGDGSGMANVEPGLTALVATRLLQEDPTDHHERRYRLLEPVRAVALERLAAGGEAGGIRQRHANWALELAQTAELGLRGAEQQRWLARLELEIDNLRAALKWFFASGQSEEGVALTSSLTHFWATRAQVSEGWRWIERGLANPDALSPATRARALSQGSWLAVLQGRPDDALRLAGDALGIFREIDDPDGIATSLDSLGELALTGGDYATAVTRFGESLAIWRSHDRRWFVAMSLISLACANLNLDDLERSRACCDDALAIMTDLEDQRGSALVVVSLGWLALRTGDIDGAKRHFDDALTTFEQIGTHVESAEALEGLAAVADATGDLKQATHHFSTAQERREAAGIHPDFMSRIGHQSDRRALRARLSAAGT